MTWRSWRSKPIPIEIVLDHRFKREGDLLTCSCGWWHPVRFEREEFILRNKHLEEQEK